MRILLAGLLLASLFSGCMEFKETNACADDSSVQITFDNTPCRVPCRKTFNLSNFNLIQGAELLWTLAGPNGPVTLDDPKSATIDVDLLEGGVYTIAAQVGFDFDGCDFSRDNTFAVGVDPPMPVLKVSATSCTVGACNLQFWQENADTTSLSWTFPGDPNDYANQDTVMHSFNDAPGTYEVCLTACNLGGCDSACVNITVLPKTFTLKGDGGIEQQLKKIIYIKENADGSFSAIGANPNQTFTIDITRDGVLMAESFVGMSGLEDVYDEHEAEACRPLGNNYLAYGNARRGQNTDMYVASFNPNLVPNTEETLFQTNTGTELISGITSGINGGVVAAGTASGGMEAGMVFFEADESLILQKGKLHFSGSSTNKALDILRHGNNYVVAGRARNTDSNSTEGAYFYLNANLDIEEGSINFLGANYVPAHLVASGPDVILVSKKGLSTSVIRPLINASPETAFSNTTFSQSMITSDNRLATVGYNGSESEKKPLLQILSLPDLKVLNTVNDPYPVDNAELLCISETADGGFIMGGTIHIDGRDQILIIRTNNEGKL